MISFDDAVGRMVEGQKHIYYLQVPNRALAESSPHVCLGREQKATRVLNLASGGGAHLL